MSGHGRLFILTTLAVIAFAAGASAQVKVEKRGGAAKSRVDLSRMSAAGGQAASFKKVLTDDLVRSGWFIVSTEPGGAIVVSGACEDNGSKMKVRCRVDNLTSRKTLLDKPFSSSSSEFRRLAHEVADAIVVAVAGCPGIASTRIAMIGNMTGAKEIYVCDYDGFNTRRITNDKALSTSPSWNEKGNAIFYASDRGMFWGIYRIDLSGQLRRDKITGLPGMNHFPAISPDGSTMAMVLSKDGNPELYCVNLRAKSLKRLTSTPKAGEASPSWSPDGSQLVFTSDISGRPHLYVMSRNGGSMRRITAQGAQNIAPHWGPNGQVVYTSLRGGCYQICVTDPSGAEPQESQVTTDGSQHEDPSWAPDGRHVVYTRSDGHRSSIYVLDTLGDPPIRLSVEGGNWYSPAWSPK